MVGANKDRLLIINPDTLIKCTNTKEKVYHGHNLGTDIIRQLPKELRNPCLILKGSLKNTYVAVSTLRNKNNKEIIITIKLNDKQQRHYVNRITSAYGKDGFYKYLSQNIKKGNLVAVNLKKAETMI